MKMPSFSLKEMFEIKIITLYGRSFIYLNYVCWGRKGFMGAMSLETKEGVMTLESWVTVSCTMWVPGTEPRFSRRAEYILIH